MIDQSPGQVNGMWYIYHIHTEGASAALMELSQWLSKPKGIYLPLGRIGEKSMTGMGLILLDTPALEKSTTQRKERVGLGRVRGERVWRRLRGIG